jgi:hypothetical protein
VLKCLQHFKDFKYALWYLFAPFHYWLLIELQHLFIFILLGNLITFWFVEVPHVFSDWFI